MRNNLRISVITAVFNNRDTIADAINSALLQKDVALELVVIDGASTDGTLDVLRGFSDRISLLVSEPDGGIYEALNKGLERASGDVVGFLHSDDLFADTTVLSCIAQSFVDPSVDAVYGDLLYVRKGDTSQVVRYWRAGEYSQSRLRWGWMPPHPTFYVRRSVYGRLGRFDTNFRIAADYDCLLRFLGSGCLRVVYLPKVLVKMRVGGASNRSISNVLRKSAEDYRALRRNKMGGLGALVWKNLSKLKQFWGADS